MKNFGINEDAYKAVLANNLRNALALRDMSQRELARRLNVSSTIVSDWCSGKKSPRMDKVDAICKILNVTRTALLVGMDREQDEEPTEEEYRIAKKIANLDPYRKRLILTIINEPLEQ